MEDDILKLRNEGLTYDEIVNKLSCSKSTVSYYCRKNGISIYDNSFKNINNILLKMQNFYNEGHSIREVAKEFNVTIYSSKKYLITRKRIFLKNDIDKKQSKVKGVIYWRQRAKLKLIEYKGGKCQVESCGYNRSVWSLGFHHIDPKNKDFNVSGRTIAFEKMKKEIDKCVLVCNNCHGEIHEEIKQNGYSDIVNKIIK